jgi:dTDP-4-dehydrorhamnose 3,5-epimerase
VEAIAMRLEPGRLPGTMRITPAVHADDRGFFFESHSARLRAALGCSAVFVQENVSGSRRGVLRGLHYQLAPLAQGKLVRVTRGAAFDVAVDLRRSSPTFGQWESVELTAENRLHLWIPPGLAHGFCVLSEFAELAYSVTQPYSAAHERTILWSDPDLRIDWPRWAEGFVLSEKDRNGARLRDAEINFD